MPPAQGSPAKATTPAAKPQTAASKPSVLRFPRQRRRLRLRRFRHICSEASKGMTADANSDSSSEGHNDDSGGFQGYFEAGRCCDHEDSGCGESG